MRGKPPANEENGENRVRREAKFPLFAENAVEPRQFRFNTDPTRISSKSVLMSSSVLGVEPVGAV